MKTKSIIHCFAHWPAVASIFALAFFALLTGCQTNNRAAMQRAGALVQGTNEVVLKEGDSVKVSFPGNDSLTTVQSIRVDGKITLPTVGEVLEAGKTPTELQKELITAYSSQIRLANEITVSVQSSSFNVFVSGAVEKSGKVICDHPMTVLEAIMESGGPDFQRANLKGVRVIRNVNGKTVNYRVNLKGLVDGRSQIDAFYLRGNDFVFVPSKITWF